MIKKFLEEIENHEISVNVESNGLNLDYYIRDVIISSSNEIIGNNNEIVIDWEKAKIAKEDDFWVITLPASKILIQVF